MDTGSAYTVESTPMNAVEENHAHNKTTYIRVVFVSTQAISSLTFMMSKIS